MSIAKNTLTALVLAGIFAYLLFFIGSAIVYGTFFTPLVLTYVCVTAFVATRVWPNFLYSILLPYTEWKMYKRDYVRLNRVYRKTLRLAKPLGLSRYAEIVTRCNLGNVQLQMGEYEEGEAIYKDSLRLLKKMRPTRQYKNIQQLYNVYINCGLAVALCHQEKFLEAELVMADVFDILNSKQAAAGLYEGYAFYLLGHIRLGLKEGTAEENILKAIQLIQTVKGSSSVREHSRSQMLNACNLALARIYAENARVEDVKKYHDKFFADLEEGRSTISPLAVRDLNAIARHFLSQHEYARAEKTLQLSYVLMAPTPFAPLAKQVLSLYETLLIETNRANEVLDLKSWLHPVSLLTQV